MKNLLRFLPFLAMIVFACTVDSNDILEEDNLLITAQSMSCIDDDPITRVVNNGTVSFNLLVVAEDGTILVDIPNIPANSTTSWASFPQGEVLFSLDTDVTQVNDDKVVLQMDTCMAYDIEIDSNNEIVSYTPTNL